MHQLASVFAEYCKKNLSLYSIQDHDYNSLSACILDCVFSLTANYEVTIKVVDRYARKYMGGNRFASGDLLDDFINRIEALTPDVFANVILSNRQVSGHILKTQVCLNLAMSLKAAGVETIEDFKNYPNQEKLYEIVKSAKGMGDACSKYLFMLLRNPEDFELSDYSRRCINQSCKAVLDNEDYNTIFNETVDLLNIDYPKLTRRDLDFRIWHFYQLRAHKISYGHRHK